MVSACLLACCAISKRENGDGAGPQGTPPLFSPLSSSSSSYFSGEDDDSDMVLELGKWDAQTMFSFCQSCLINVVNLQMLSVVFNQCRQFTNAELYV